MINTKTSLTCIPEESIVKQRLLVSDFFILFQSRPNILLFSGRFMTLM